MFYVPLEGIKKPEVFWYSQGVINGISDCTEFKRNYKSKSNSSVLNIIVNQEMI